MRGTKKRTSNKSKKTLKRLTIKPKIFIRRFGDFALCYRVNNSKPTCVRKQYNSIHRNSIRGGADPIDNDTMKPIISRLITEISGYVSSPANKKAILDNITMKTTDEKGKEGVYNALKTLEPNLIDDIMEKYAKPTSDSEDIYNKLFAGINTEINNPDKITIFTPTKNELNANIGTNLLKIILTRALKIYYSNVVKSILKTQVDQNIISKDIETKLLTTLDEKPANMMSKASAITDKAFAGISSGALKMAQWISPTATDAPNYNETSVQLLWYPQKHIQYAKGQAIPSKKTKYGDMVVKIQDKYANLSQYFAKSVNGVDDLLANMANGCKDATCKTGDTHPKPFKIKTLTTKENFSKSGSAPEIEMNET